MTARGKILASMLLAWAGTASAGGLGGLTLDARSTWAIPLGRTGGDDDAWRMAAADTFFGAIPVQVAAGWRIAPGWTLQLSGSWLWLDVKPRVDAGIPLFVASPGRSGYGLQASLEILHRWSPTLPFHPWAALGVGYGYASIHGGWTSPGFVGSSGPDSGISTLYTDYSWARHGPLCTAAVGVEWPASTHVALGPFLGGEAGVYTSSGGSPAPVDGSPAPFVRSPLGAQIRGWVQLGVAARVDL